MSFVFFCCLCSFLVLSSAIVCSDSQICPLSLNWCPSYLHAIFPVLGCSVSIKLSLCTETIVSYFPLRTLLLLLILLFLLFEAFVLSLPTLYLPLTLLIPFPCHRHLSVLCHVGKRDSWSFQSLLGSGLYNREHEVRSAVCDSGDLHGAEAHWLRFKIKKEGAVKCLLEGKKL